MVGVNAIDDSLSLASPALGLDIAIGKSGDAELAASVGDAAGDAVVGWRRRGGLSSLATLTPRVTHRAAWGP